MCGFGIYVSGFVQFDPFFAGSIAICARWIHLRLVRFIFEAFDLLFGGPFNNVSTRFILFFFVT